MDVDELIKKAWDAVDKAGIPGPIQGVALKEAIDFLRDGGTPTGSGSAGASGRGSGSGTRKKKGGQASTKTKPDTADVEVPSEDDFFDRLAEESGVDRVELTDCLQLSPDGTIHITVPTKDLGSTLTKQARSVVALVAGARAKGMDEKPVSAEAVRKGAERKHCYDSTNFTGYHLKKMKGFNAGADGTIVLNSKWVKEFEDAVKQANGTTEK